MTLNKDGWFVKYWLRLGCFSKYTYNECYNADCWYYKGTNMCQVARTAFLWAPLRGLFFLIGIGFALFVLSALGWGLIFDTLKFGMVFGIIALGIACVAGTVWAIHVGIPTAATKIRESDAARSAVSWYDGFKHKYCAFVEIK